MTDTGHAPRDDNGGFAIFVVLSFLLITIAIITPILAGVRFKALMTSNTAEFTREKLLARGLLEIAAVRYFERYQDATVKPATDVGCPKIHYHFQDHSGLIDLNGSTAQVLSIGFESLGLPKQDAAKTAEEVIRFRSTDGGGALQSDTQPPKGGYKHALFENTVETLELAGTNGLSLWNINKVFTVKSGTGTLDETALQEPLSGRIKLLNAGEKFFLVNDIRRTNAITVSAYFDAGREQTGAASALFGPANDVGLVSFLEPPSYKHGNDRNKARGQNQISCEDFFDPVLITMLNNVLP